jgi:hypothetical protein
LPPAATAARLQTRQSAVTMKRFKVFGAVVLTVLIFAVATPAQTTTAQGAPVKSDGVDVAAIIRAFTAKETEFRRALNGYTFTRDATVQTIGLGGEITGEYQRTSQFTFDGEGNRFERITHFPVPTLTEVSFSNEDLEDLGGVQPFALEASKIDRYNFTYVGKEQVDELSTYVFDVSPKVMPKKESERLFQGRVWVDDRDLQIVKARGKGVPEAKQRFPVFETYRQQIDGKYWFPTYSYADDTLTFPGGQVVHIRMVIRYTDYKRFQGKVRVIEEGEPGDVQEPAPAPSRPKP